jgi:hypothetical protein
MSNAATGNGVSAGIDMALSLTERVHGRELAESLQLVIEYDRCPVRLRLAHQGLCQHAAPRVPPAARRPSSSHGCAREWPCRRRATTALRRLLSKRRAKS